MPRSAQRSAVAPFAMYPAGVYRGAGDVAHASYWGLGVDGWPIAGSLRVALKGSAAAARAVLEIEAMLDNAAPGWRRDVTAPLRVVKRVSSLSAGAYLRLVRPSPRPPQRRA